MRLQRTLAGMVIAFAAGAAAAQANGSLKWRAGAVPLGVQPPMVDVRVQCGALTLACPASTSVPLYAHPTAPRSVTLQVGPAGTRDAQKPASAQAVSVGLVGKAGIAPDLGVYGRVGASFGRTSAFAPGLFGGAAISYGVGLSWDFSRSASAVLGWDSYDVRSPTGEARDVRATSLGLHWRY